MKKTMMMALVALLPLAAFAGDGTKENPYTVSELNAQKDALATSGATVWVKADLKGLGEDGSLSENTETNQMAGLFGDATGTFVAYSFQILQGLAMSDLTNTKDLLISLTYGTAGHPYGNSTYPQYASNKEPTDAHFSLEEVHGALSLSIENGYRGYHIQSCYIVPKEIVAARVSSNFSGGKGTINYGYYDGAEEGKTFVINKNTALVFLAYDGTYDFVLSAGYYEQINSNSLIGGTQAGLNVGTGKSNEDRWRFRFVSRSDKAGFERNSYDNATVILASKDEIYLQVVSREDHFAGNYEWENPERNWITWGGDKISDHHTTGITEMVNGQSSMVNEKTFDLQGREVSQPTKGVYIKNGKKFVAK
jgi:hypothetical protein